MDVATLPVAQEDTTISVPVPGFAQETLCRLRVYRGRDGRKVALVTELGTNRGPSITNAAEHVWFYIRRRGLGAMPFVMVEHYNGESYGQPPPGGCRRGRADTFDRVTVEDGRPTWQPLGADGFRALLATGS